jgi:hypothetical protein
MDKFVEKNGRTYKVSIRHSHDESCYSNSNVIQRGYYLCIQPIDCFYKQIKMLLLDAFRCSEQGAKIAEDMAENFIDTLINKIETEKSKEIL